ncbi:MAG: 50S ribosomal protein L10 [Halobacteriales archaeon]
MAGAEHKTETVPEWKRKEVDELVALVESYDSVGVVDLTGIPSRQLQDMRADLHGSAELRMSRNTLLRRALEEVDEGAEDLVEYVEGHVGLLATNENPFGLYQQLEASKTSAPISAGEVAPNDIVIPEGDTGMDPGPFVGELQEVGASARIDEGSIKVLEDSTVLEADEEVSQALEGVLGELGIEPKEVGLDLRAVYGDGVLFEADELGIDVEDYRRDVETAAARGRNLALNAEFPTASTLPSLLGKASGDAKGLAVHAAIEDPDVMPDLVSRADARMRALAASIDDEEALPEELRDVEVPEPTEESTTEDDDESDTEPEADGDDDEEEEDDGDGAEGLGEMFG